VRIAATIGQLCGHPQVPDREDHRQGRDDHRDGGHLTRRNRRQHHEEAVEHDRPEDRDPEGEPQAANQAGLPMSCEWLYMLLDAARDTLSKNLDEFVGRAAVG
jgi:hypothetical protein